MRSRFLFGFTAAATLALGGCAAEMATEHDEDAEAEAADSRSQELVSSVDCRERSDTAYTSGSAHSIRVITIGGKPVSKPTGHAFLRMQRAAHEAGVYLSLTSGFRTNAEQQHLYGCYVNGNCNGGNLAARPGYSNHQNGRAVDLTTSPWLASNASRFGFVRTVPSESWHYEYTGSADPGGPCGDGDGEIAADTIPWESPQEGGDYMNGIWLKVRSSHPSTEKVMYYAGSYLLGTSKDRADDYSLRYTFSVTGYRSLTAQAYDGSGRKLAQSTITIRVVD